MTYQEKRSLVYLFCNFLIIAFFALFWIETDQDWGTDLVGSLKEWGKTILLLIPIHIGLFIGVMILFSIGNAIATQDPDIPITDERDKKIELKANRNGFLAFFLFFTIAITTILLDYSPTVMFNGIMILIKLELIQLIQQIQEIKNLN